MKIRRSVLLLNPMNTHCKPNCWAMYPEKLEASEPNPKAMKKKIPKAVPLISTVVYWAKRVLFMGWRKKLNRKKMNARTRSRRSVVKDMAKIKGKVIMEIIRNFLSRFGFCDNIPPPYWPSTPIESTMAESIPPMATLSREKI